MRRAIIELTPRRTIHYSYQYDKKHIHGGLKYVEYTTRNSECQLPPTGIRALGIYKDVCTLFVDIGGGKIYKGCKKEVQAVRKELTASIKECERSINFTGCHRGCSANASRNFLAAACKELFKDVEAKKIEGWKSMQRSYWTNIGTKIQEEKPWYELMLKGGKFPKKCQNSLNVAGTCQRVGFEVTDMLGAIHLYAARDELPEANLPVMVREGLYMDLKKRLHDDFCYIPLVVPVTEHILLELILKVLGAIINLWFDQDLEDPDNYQMWTQSANLKNLWKEILGTNACKESDVKRRISATIVESIRRPFGDSQQEEETVDSIQNELELVSNQKLGGFGSAHLLLELEGVKQMQEDWHKIMSMVSGRKKLSDTYLM